MALRGNSFFKAIITADESHPTIIPASDILKRIENGDPAIYDHVVIAGDLDIHLIDLPIVHFERPAGQEQTASVVSSKIQIRNCEFLGIVDFEHVMLREALDMSGSIFLQEARFKGAYLKEKAEFEASSFRRYATFRDATFAKDARFQGAFFHAIANFGNASFRGPASFGSARFSDMCTNFGETRFLEDADFTGARFSGSANFRFASFARAASFWKAVFSSDGNFQGAKVQGYASFQSAEVSGNADFRGAFFGAEVNLEFASILGTAIFLGSCVSGSANLFRARLKDANFEESSMLGPVQFSEATLGKASFLGAQFHKEISFQGSSFQKEANFLRAAFQGAANLSGAKFLGTAVFDHAVFWGPAEFQDAVFQSQASFQSARYSGDASFRSNQFQAKAHFESAQFLENAFFQGAVFQETAYFTASSFHKDLRFDGARINVIRLSDAAISGQISLHNADFIRLEARWQALCDHLTYDGAAYLALAKNFRNLEWFEDADDCYYCYRRMSQSNKVLLLRAGNRIEINWSKLLDGLALISCGYGVRPRRTLFLSGSLILFFALLFWAGRGIVVEPLNGSSPSIGTTDDLTFVDNLYFSAMVFTAKTQVKWYPIGFYRYLATLESVLGWLLLALFLVTLGRTMIR
jgi:hypothetical protein